MTIWGRDASDFDQGSINFAGLGFFTSKSSEGATVQHHSYGPHLNAAKTAGVPVVGSYHVVRTPSNTQGNLTAQLQHWLTTMDQATPWWRTHPHFVLQIDAEKWPYDAVSASVVKQFAQMLVGFGIPGYKVTYASRGQYGDSLNGIATDLWNADYRGSSAGSYPGDGWVASGGSAAGWAGYSGKTPVFLQYTSTPYDKDAFRGTLDQLLALTGGSANMSDETVPFNTERLANGSETWGRAGITGEDPAHYMGGVGRGIPATAPNILHHKLDTIITTTAADLAEDRAATAALKTISDLISAAGGSVDIAPVLAAVADVRAAESATVTALQATQTALMQQISDLQHKLAKAAQNAATDLT